MSARASAAGHDSIAPRSLGDVEAPVGNRDELLGGRVGAVIEGCRARANRAMDHVILVSNGARRHGVPQALTDALGSVEGDPSQGDGELFPAVAREDVLRSQDVNELSRELDQGGVSGLVSVGVVDRFEVVEVDEHEAQDGLVSAGIAHLGLQTFVQVLAIVRARQGVTDAGLVEVPKHSLLVGVGDGVSKDGSWSELNDIAIAERVLRHLDAADEGAVRGSQVLEVELITLLDEASVPPTDAFRGQVDVALRKPPDGPGVLGEGEDLPDCRAVHAHEDVLSALRNHGQERGPIDDRRSLTLVVEFVRHVPRRAMLAYSGLKSKQSRQRAALGIEPSSHRAIEPSSHRGCEARDVRVRWRGWPIEARDRAAFPLAARQDTVGGMTSVFPTQADVVIIGGGHNALVAATLIARSGLSTVLLEGREVLGGAVRTEYPFERAPSLGASTGAYLLGLMPPEILAALDLELPLLRRDPHYFLPTMGDRYLLLGSDEDAVRRQFVDFFSERDYEAHRALQDELARLREDLAPTWLCEPYSIEETAERYVRPTLRRTFVELCRGSIGDYLARFDFQSELVMAMYAVTDAFSGLSAGWDTPGTGMNFLVHNMCRLPGSGGTWMIVEGGMGTVTQRLAAVAERSGARLLTGLPVASVAIEKGRATGVVLADGRDIRAEVVVSGTDPFALRALVGSDRLPAAYNRDLDAKIRDGSTLKVNLALNGLPRFTCLPEPRGQHGTTIHLLPQERPIEALRRAFADAQAGHLPEFPAIEWYTHTPVDPSLRDADGHENAALFVQWVPYALSGTTWEAEEARYTEHLLSICDRFAPGTSDLVVETFVLHPQRIESHFGMTRGHIHHVDNTFGFADRVPYRTPVEGLYAVGAGCHPAGSVIGAAGYVGARCVLDDLGRGGGSRSRIDGDL
jgi:phytoene dehydrogenase-like protein